MLVSDAYHSFVGRLVVLYFAESEHKAGTELELNSYLKRKRCAPWAVALVDLLFTMNGCKQPDPPLSSFQFPLHTNIQYPMHSHQPQTHVRCMINFALR